MFFAHSLPSHDEGGWQALFIHLTEVSRRAAGLAAPLGLPLAAALAGLAHDLGKYDRRFQDYIRGRGDSVDHSTAGGAILLGMVGAPAERIAAEALAYCILGHHAGLPDRRNGGGSLEARRGQFTDRLDPAWREEITLDLAGIWEELRAHVSPGEEKRGFDLSVAVRMLFSCLVEADFLDTEAFYAPVQGPRPDRTWDALPDLLPTFQARFDAHMGGLGGEGWLNALRRDILRHVRAGAALPPGLFTLTVPTGGGKTLASLGFALDHAAAHGHRRILYAIPFTSIIDQTAAIFRNVLGEEAVLEHHSAIDEEETGNRPREGRDKLRLAMENWAAPVIVTTNVQLFESLYAARPSRARKLHNIAGSVIVLDEAQTLPRKLLRPCLRMLDCLARHWGCSVVFCTATQPSVGEALRGEFTLDPRELAPDPVGLAKRLKRARVVDGGEMDNAALIAALEGVSQGFVVVNSRRHALDLYRAAQAAGLNGLVHLTTRQTAADRARVLEDVRARLKAGTSCRLIATSLIEAGVDLDFPAGWRAKAGLDQILQAAGRINREGRRPEGVLRFFTSADYPVPPEVKALIGDMERSIRAEDFQSLGAIERYFAEIYWRMRGSGQLDAKGICGSFLVSRQGTDFAFRTVAEKFRMIETTMLPVVIPRGVEDVIARLSVEAIPSGALARDLQRHVVLVPEKARARMVACGKAAFAARQVRGDQFCVLEAGDLYHADSGLWWEDAEYLGAEEMVI